jgi:hypothetical protein
MTMMKMTQNPYGLSLRITTTSPTVKRKALMDLQSSIQSSLRQMQTTNNTSNQDRHQTQWNSFLLMMS